MTPSQQLTYKNQLAYFGRHSVAARFVRSMPGHEHYEYEVIRDSVAADTPHKRTALRNLWMVASVMLPRELGDADLIETELTGKVGDPPRAGATGTAIVPCKHRKQ